MGTTLFNNVWTGVRKGCKSTLRGLNKRQKSILQLVRVTGNRSIRGLGRKKRAF